MKHLDNGWIFFSERKPNHKQVIEFFTYQIQGVAIWSEYQGFCKVYMIYNENEAAFFDECPLLEEEFPLWRPYFKRQRMNNNGFPHGPVYWKR